MPYSLFNISKLLTGYSSNLPPQFQDPSLSASASSSTSRSKKRSSNNNASSASSFTLSGGVSVTAIQEEHTANPPSSNHSIAAPSGGGSSLMQPKVDLFIRTDNVSLIPIDRDVKAKLRWAKCPFL